MIHSFMSIEGLQSRPVQANILRTVEDTNVTHYTFEDNNVFSYFPKFERERCSRWMHFGKFVLGF